MEFENNLADCYIYFSTSEIVVYTEKKNSLIMKKKIETWDENPERIEI